jgi:hypothetical protein
MNRLLLVAVLWMVSAAVYAEDVIGFVKTISGTAAVVTKGKGVKAELGTPVYMNSTLKTASNSAMGVTFKDNTVMSFGANTEMTIDEFLYSPGKDQLAINAKITKGTMDYVSGVVAKLKPEAVAIKTPSGTIGVRGTHFMVKVDDPSKATLDKEIEALIADASPVGVAEPVQIKNTAPPQ